MIDVVVVGVVVVSTVISTVLRITLYYTSYTVYYKIILAGRALAAIIIDEVLSRQIASCVMICYVTATDNYR
jgi:hypothetical protein